MYFSVIWEIVNSISFEYTCIFLPNLSSTSFLVMYTDVLRWTIIHEFQCEDLGAELLVRIVPFRYRSLVDSRARDFIHRSRPLSR